MKTTQTFLVLLIMSVGVSTSLSSQEIKKAHKAQKYSYEETMYKYKELEPILRQNEIAFKQFRKAHRRAQAAKVLGVSSLIITGGSILGTMTGASLSSEILFGAWYASIYLAPSMGLAGLIVYGTKLKPQRKSIEIFNEAYGLRSTDKTDASPKLDLVTENGVGLRLTF